VPSPWIKDVKERGFRDDQRNMVAVKLIAGGSSLQTIMDKDRK
jgi:hypothetical protein